MVHRVSFGEPDSSTAMHLTAIAEALYQSKRCIIVTGAGISVDAGIPDFRSEDGLYNLVKAKYPNVVLKGRDLFDASLFNDPESTKLFYTFMSELRRLTTKAQSTRTHQFIKDMATSNRLQRCYTQNIDCLESRLGLSSCLATGRTRSVGVDGTDVRTGGGGSAAAISTDSSVATGTREPMVSSLSEFSNQSTTTSASLQNSSAHLSLSQPNPTLHTKLSKPSVMSRSASSSSSNTTSLSAYKVQVVQLHGSLETVVCAFCQAVSEFTDDMASLFECGEPPTCVACEHVRAVRMAQGKRDISVGLLRPNIVLYNEHHREGDKISQMQLYDMKKRPDMLIVMGTSLKVIGVRNLIKEFSKSVHTSKSGICVFINVTDVAVKEWDNVFDYQVIGRSDDVVAMLWNNVVRLSATAEQRKAKREMDRLKREEKLARQNAALTPIGEILKKTKAASIAVNGASIKDAAAPQSQRDVHDGGVGSVSSPDPPAHTRVEMDARRTTTASMSNLSSPTAHTKQTTIPYASIKSRSGIHAEPFLSGKSLQGMPGTLDTCPSSPFSSMSTSSTVSLSGGDLIDDGDDDTLFNDKENTLPACVMAAFGGSFLGSGTDDDGAAASSGIKTSRIVGGAHSKTAMSVVMPTTEMLCHGRGGAAKTTAANPTTSSGRARQTLNHKSDNKASVLRKAAGVAAVPAGATRSSARLKSGS
ncbi:hypothetical protein BASA84_001577 [Batrachochytrium salamandrivorans]|nr:hypothetical protein BASA81_007005 [Batrachochytrium salamandrivorans]KAH9265573.1 hypothetical protein BASA84_001577 [Batrachochytrium salamandrivorans]